MQLSRHGNLGPATGDAAAVGARRQGLLQLTRTQTPRASRARSPISLACRADDDAEQRNDDRESFFGRFMEAAGDRQSVGAGGDEHSNEGDTAEHDCHQNADE